MGIGLAALLIILVNVVGWLAFFVGVYIAIYRHVRRRGRIIMLSVSGALLMAVLALILVPLSRARLGQSEPVNHPSPSSALVSVSLSVDSGASALSALSARDGAIRWRSPLPVSHASDALAPDGALYVTDGSSLTAVRASDGRQLWRQTLSQTGIISSLAVRGNSLLYITVSNLMYEANALDLTTHTLRWSHPLSHYLEDDLFPAFVASADTLYVGSDDGEVNALRLSDGALAWSRQVIAPTALDTHTFVALGAQLLYVYDASGDIYALRLSDGAAAWRSPLLIKPYEYSYLIATPTSLYACAGVPRQGFTASAIDRLDPATGALLWQREDACTPNRVIVTDTAIYLTPFGLTMQALHASDGQSLWTATTHTPDLGFTSVQVDHGVIIAAATVVFPHDFITCPTWWTGGPLFCHSTSFVTALDAATGQRYWQTTVSEYPALLGVEAT